MFLCCRGLPLISSASSCFWLVYKIAFVLFNICLVMITQWERSPNWSTTILTLIRSCSSLCLQIYFSSVLSYRIKIYMARCIYKSSNRWSHTDIICTVATCLTFIQRFNIFTFTFIQSYNIFTFTFIQRYNQFIFSLGLSDTWNSIQLLVSHQVIKI